MMNWKNWSYAKKGAVVGLLVGILILAHIFLSGCHTSFQGPDGCHNQIELYIALFEFGLMIFPLGPIVVFPLIGALIGWIIGKIKSAKQKT